MTQLLPLLALALCGCQHRDGPDYLVEHDTASHVTAGALTVVGVDYLLRDRLPQPWRALTGVAAAAVLGQAKERLYDKRASAKDANAWLVGAVPAAAVTYVWEY